MPGAHLRELDDEASLALQGELGRWRKWKWSPPTTVTLGNLGAWAALAVLGAFRLWADARPVLGASLGNLGALATLAILGSLGRWCRGKFSPPTSVTLGNLGAGAALAILGAFRRRVEERLVLGASLGNLGAVATLAVLGSLGTRPMGVLAFPVSQPEGGVGDAFPSSGT